jgi:hypothetical protein
MLKWIKKLFEPSETNIWKTVKTEYLREEIDWGNCPQQIQTMYVFAVTEFCLLTGKTRMFEKRDFFPPKEFDILEQTRQSFIFNQAKT